MKEAVLIFLLHGLLLNLSAQNPEKKPFIYTDSIYEFSIQFPNEYETRFLKNSEANQKTLKSSADQDIYLYTETRHNKSFKKNERKHLASVTLDGFTEVAHGRILSKEEITYGNYIGLNTVMELPGKDMIVYHKVLVNKHMQFELVVILNSKELSKPAQTFLSGLKPE